jgi:6-methylsalicylate decarboxylase
VRHQRAFTRRDLIGAGSFAVISFFGRCENIFAQQKKPLCIDVHTHLWPDEYLNLIESYGRTDINIQRSSGAGASEREIEKRFTMMDAAGIDLQILSIAPYVPHFENKAQAVTAARKANDIYAETVRRWSNRFAAYASLPLPHVDESLEEIDRAIGQLGLHGVVLTTDILGRPIADPGFSPIYEEMNRRGRMIFVHPSGKGALTPLIANYKISQMIGAPVETTVAILHLMMQGIPGHFPKLKIIAAHLGGALPMVLARLDCLYASQHPRMPERPSLAARRMWYDTRGRAGATRRGRRTRRGPACVRK